KLNSVLMLRHMAQDLPPFAALEVLLTTRHKPAKSLDIVRANDRSQTFDRVEQRSERLGAVVVQGLDFEVEVGIFGGDLTGDTELRIERGRRQRRELGRCFTALGKRGEERDVDRVR